MPRVDEVETIRRVEPRALGVVYHKPDVRRHPRRLDRTQVDAENLRAWILIAHYKHKEL
jgi:hypothetical protein